jgi:serine/threonine-protein kinase
MEYLDGRALSDIIAREAPFPAARALAIAAQIADALGAAHAHGVIHRDLKPENVFLVARGDDPAFVKVLDFGLAKLVNVDGGLPHETRAGIVMGTPYYMSPEQCEGRGEIDARADIYSLGIVLFEMLTGHLPFGGAATGEILMKHLTMRPPAARSLVPELPDALDAILDRALAKRPAQRFATMALLRAALLEPAGYAATAPRSWVPDALPRRLRGAQPMSRAEIARRRTLAATRPTTLDAGAVAVDAEVVDRVPVHTAPRIAAILAVMAVAGAVLAAGVGNAGAVRRAVMLAPQAVLAVSRSAAATTPPGPAGTVTLTFASEPSGASIVDADGTKLGLTPLSIRVARSGRPARYRFEKAGFAPKDMESIPNVASSMFVRLQPEEPRGDADTSAARARAKRRFQQSLDRDGVLAPSFAE